MRENQLSVHYTSAEETGRVRPAVDSGDGGVHIPRERDMHVEARPAGNYLADDLSNSVQITLAHFSAGGSALAASAVAIAPRALPGPRNQEARDSKLGTWLLASAVISVTTLYTLAPASLGDVDRSAAQHYGSSSGAHRTLTSDRDETGTRENSRRHTHNGNRAARSNAGDSGSGGGMLPALSAQSKPITNNPMDFMNQGFNQGFTSPATEMPKAAEAKTSKSKKGFLVPPPPPTPCVLPPGFGFFPMQAAQQQQQLQLAQAQASPRTHNQAAARENTPQQPTAASGSTEATQSAALVAADQEFQAAVSSSLRTVGEWTR
jgi:hypothetical protein